MDLVVKAPCFCSRKKSLKLSGESLKIEVIHNHELFCRLIE